MNKVEQELAFLIGKEIIVSKHGGKQITGSSYSTMGKKIRIECKIKSSISFSCFALLINTIFINLRLLKV
jgi:hypothetical protein